jgi:hypothetical protein
MNEEQEAEKTFKGIQEEIRVTGKCIFQNRKYVTQAKE